MKAKVTRVYSKGKKIAATAKSEFFEGDLNVSDGRHPVMNRLEKEASLLSEDGSNIIPPMIGVQLSAIYGKGMVLRGIEVVGDREFSQEWWVEPLAK